VTITVTLDPGEMAVAQTLATLRCAVNQAAGVVDRRRATTRDPLALDLLGTVSEIAFCKQFGAYPDMTVTPRRGGHDVILNGRRWDIKATDKPHHQLLAHPGKSLGDVDRYALAIVVGNVVDLIGWATAGHLLHPSTVTDLGHGPVHALKQDQLQPFPAVAL
jgi:hypothetical protein